MERASAIMYKLGKIFGIIEIVGSVIVIIYSVLLLALAPAAANQSTSMELAGIVLHLSLVAIYLIYGIVMLVLGIVSLAMATSARKKIEAEVPGNKYHIIMIVAGGLNSVFFLLSGIFSLIASHQKYRAVDAE